MKCNVTDQHSTRKPNKIALIKNKKKIQKVGELGMLYDKLEAQYKQTENPDERSDIKAKMDKIEEQIITLSNEVKAEVYKNSKKSSDNEAPSCVNEAAVSSAQDENVTV